jgi:hypothetical protein
MGVLLLIGLTSAGVVVSGQIALPTAPPTQTSTFTPRPTRTSTPAPPTATLTPTLTSTSTTAPTGTSTVTPTPMYAVVQTTDHKGAVLRAQPGGEVLRSYFDGTLMQVLPDTATVEGVVWVHVVGPDGVEGWMVERLLATATPAPDWEG